MHVSDICDFHLSSRFKEKITIKGKPGSMLFVRQT
ncbi:protein of unknown function [Candidatus Methylocalor cossyra]|uniref:Uncharacterized protein n=1 Tax=Candidatus Methylocalor cossyra TaxID=3108543 RepID=A0ABM9NI82_9GAMM